MTAFRSRTNRQKNVLNGCGIASQLNCSHTDLQTFWKLGWAYTSSKKYQIRYRNMLKPTLFSCHVKCKSKYLQSVLFWLHKRNFIFQRSASKAAKLKFWALNPPKWNSVSLSFSLRVEIVINLKPFQPSICIGCYHQPCVAYSFPIFSSITTAKNLLFHRWSF